MRIKLIITLVVIIQLVPLFSFSNIIFVNQSATGNETGLTWEDAFSDLQNALAIAQVDDEIWVAQGTYIPTSDTTRTIYFSIPNRVKLYGGFLGNEVNEEERDHINNLTILSGNIGLSDSTNDNSYTVVYFDNTDSLTVIDGFTIRDGYADNQEQFVLQTDVKKAGAGIYLDNNASPIIKNCIISNNFSKINGAGIFKFKQGNPLLKDCIIQDNRSEFDGAGVYYREGGKLDTDLLLFKNVVFLNNMALLGTFYYDGLEGKGNMVFDSCTFYNNNASSILYFNDTPSSSVRLEISDSKFEENITSANGAFAILYFFGFGEITTDSLTLIENTNFIKNQGTSINYSIYPFPNTANPTLHINNSKFEENQGKFIIEYTKGNLILEDTEFRGNNIGRLITNLSTNYYVNKTKIDRCIFIENSNFESLGIFNAAPIRLTHPFELTNSQFIKNKFSTGGIIRDFNPSGIPSLISNCTFYKNEADYGGIVFSDGEVAKTLNISNSIFIDNVANIDGAFAFIEDYSDGGESYEININNSLLSQSNCDSLLVFESPSSGSFNCGDQMLFGIDPQFTDTTGLDFSLISCSPLINIGSNLFPDSLNMVSDFMGNQRIVDGIVDLGAIEVQEIFDLEIDTVFDVSCFEQMDGEVLIDTFGVTSPFNLTWTNGNLTGSDLTNMDIGNYNITITDDNNCIDSAQFAIVQPNELLFNNSIITGTTGTNISDGAIELSVMGGTLPYQYLWNTGDTTASLSNLLAGNYFVTVTDANDCILELNFTVDVMTSINKISQVKMGLSPTIITTEGGTWLQTNLKNPIDVELKVWGINGQLLKKESVSIFDKYFISLPFVQGTYIIQVLNKEKLIMESFKIQIFKK